MFDTIVNALRWYNGVNPYQSDFPEFPSAGTVVVKCEDGETFDENLNGIVFEKQLRDRPIECTAAWTDNDEPEIEVEADCTALTLSVNTSYDDQDPKSIPVSWVIKNAEGKEVTSGTGTDLVTLEFDPNESEYSYSFNYLVEIYFEAASETNLFDMTHIYVTQDGVQS